MFAYMQINIYICISFKTKDTMTTQDLKNNRNEIIARINEIADNSKMGEIMTAMVNLINGGMNEATDAIELVDEVVELFGFQKETMTSVECQEYFTQQLQNQKNTIR